MKIRTLIVDDVSLARQRIKILLRDPEVEVVGECADGGGAVEAVRELKPDLVFLDVQMPEMNGFEVIEAVGAENMPAVIFVTAFDEFAIRAFEVNAADYLLKPFDEERLNKALGRVKQRIGRPDPRDVPFEETLRRLLREVSAEEQYLKRIPVRAARGGTALVLADEIDWIGAAGHYVELHAGVETHSLREKITSLEQRLDPRKFVRVHRSAIVNIDRIKSLHPLFNGDQLIVLKNGTELNLSRTYYENLMSRLSK